MTVSYTRCRSLDIGVLTLDSAPDAAELKKVLTSRLLRMTRFKSVLKVGSFGGSFVEVDEIDWEYHLSYAFEDETVRLSKLLKQFRALRIKPTETPECMEVYLLLTIVSHDLISNV